MKRFGFASLVLSYSLFVALVSIVGSQEPMKDAPKPPIKIARIALPSGWSKLNLSKAQTSKVYEVRTTYQTKIADLNNKIDEARSEERTELIKLLTPAQLDHLKKLAGF